MCFGNKRNKELEKRMKIRKTIMEMEKQINKLEEQKESYIKKGKEAKERGLTAQYNLALSGLKMTITQQKRIMEMKLNFEITSQMKDMMEMTTNFLSGMQSLSKDMAGLTNQKQFAKTGQQFAEAMMGAEMQVEQIESFMDETEAAFSSHAYMSQDENAEIEGLMNPDVATSSASDSLSDSMIEQELEMLKKKMG